MRDLLSTNPGLESRFSQWIEFDDYNDTELAEILTGMCAAKGFVLGGGAHDAALRSVTIQRRGNNFANARAVRNVLEKAIRNASLRLTVEAQKNDKVALGTLLAADFLSGDVNAQAFRSAAEELRALRGLSAVKQAVVELEDWLSVTRLRKGALSLPDLNLHMVFVGNPGTGKTEVARLIGRRLFEMGLLPSGHVVEVDRSHLVAKYIGQTAVKTREVFEQAMGGVLFVDEAYALCRPASDGMDYGQEAIDTLLKLMEDRRGQCVVVAAGYRDQMETFLSSNPGLRSRFSQVLVFDDYTDAEMFGMLTDLAENDGFTLDSRVSERLVTILGRRRSQSGFANGRTVRELFEVAQRRHAQRIVKASRDGDSTLDESELSILRDIDFE